MRQLLTVLSIIALFAATSCDKDDKEQDQDPCDDITCLNDGYCANGECNCQDGYTGSDCGQEQTPSAVTITRVEVQEFEATDENGAGWDPGSGPDIYIKVSKEGGSDLYEHGSHYQNADPSTSYGFDLSPPVKLTDMQSQYVIWLYDYDDFDADDYMGGVLKKVYQPGSGFPSRSTWDAGAGYRFVVHYEYEW